MKKRNLAKIALENELKKEGFVFSYLTPVTNAFKKEQYNKMSEIDLTTGQVWIKFISLNSRRRAVRTNSGDWYWLTN